MTGMEESTWAEVMPGDDVMGRDRHEWKVIDTSGGITMEREGRGRVTGHPSSSDRVMRRLGPESLAIRHAVSLFEAHGFTMEPMSIQLDPGRWLAYPGRRS